MAGGARDANVASHGRRFNMRELWRLGLWGTATCVALLFLAIAGTSDIGNQRIVVAYAQIRGLAEPATQTARAADSNETRRLAETVRILSADRDRLVARLGALERNVSDMTGSTARQTEPPAAATAPQPPPPAVLAPDTTPAVNVPVPRPSPLQQQTQTPAPPDQGPSKPEYGIDLGGASTFDGLRTLWAAARNRHGALLEGLRPIVTVREVTRPGGVELRLVAGPFGSAAAAARACTTLTNAGAVCQPTVFDGQRLAARQ